MMGSSGCTLHVTYCVHTSMNEIYVLNEINFSLRLQNMFQQLEKVGGKAAKNQTGEELTQMRYASLKIYQILTTNGKVLGARHLIESFLIYEAFFFPFLAGSQQNLQNDMWVQQRLRSVCTATESESHCWALFW